VRKIAPYQEQHYELRFTVTLRVASSDIGLLTVTDADFPWGVYALVAAA
jgi:hypothetical protein